VEINVIHLYILVEIQEYLDMNFFIRENIIKTYLLH